MVTAPLHFSPIPRTPPEGWGLLGAARMGHKPMPAQRNVWKLLEARSPRGELPKYPNSVIEIPRRAGKTDALMAEVVGRCEAIPDYMAAYAAQTGFKSRDRFQALLRRMSRHGRGGVQWRALRGRGEERFEWENGSVFAFVPPKADAWRGEALDMAVLDEAQLHDPDDAADLLGAILPVFWTRPDAQLVVAGTAGETRDGLLWQALEQGRAGAWGILEYALAEGLDPELEESWLAAHPGVAGVSTARTLAVLRMSHEQMGPEEFGREVLGVWPEVSVAVVFPAALWDSLGVSQPPDQPRRFGLAFEVTPDGERAAVTATWRDGPISWGGVLREDPGMDWVPAYVASVARRARVPIWHDSTPNNSAVASQIHRALPGVDVHACTALEYASGCALLHSEVLAGTFRHTRQAPLDGAVAVAAKRPLLDGGWAWGRKASTGYIHPLVGVSVGLRAFDSLPAQRMTRVMTAR